jgi:hypothetical protein
MNVFVPALVNPSAFPADSDKERAAADAITTFRTTGNAYLIEQNTRPQAIGYALLDSSVALAAWMLDHDTDAYDKIASAFVDGKPSGNLAPDHILDTITTYWLTATGASAARSYWEGEQAGAAAAAVGNAPRRSRCPLDSPRSPARSVGPRAAGSSRPTQPSSTSTRSTREPLRGLGRARPLRDRATGRIQVASLAGRGSRSARMPLLARGARVAQLRATPVLRPSHC